MVQALLAGDLAAAQQYGLRGDRRRAARARRGPDHRGVRRATPRRWLAAAEHPRFGVPFRELDLRADARAAGPPARARLPRVHRHRRRRRVRPRGRRRALRRPARRRRRLAPCRSAFERRDGRVVLVRKAAMLGSPNEGEPKAVNIQAHIGRRPILAAGNSAGDREMLEYAHTGERPSLCLVVDHDDDEREYAYAGAAVTNPDAEPILDTAGRLGWTVVSMRDDWSRVFARDDAGCLDPGATFRMGSDAHYPEEAPAATGGGRRVLDRPRTRSPTAASRPSWRRPATSPSPSARSTRPTSRARRPRTSCPGSLVFTRTRGPVDLRHLSQWWTWTPGASWRAPEGPGSTLAGREEHPVVHVAYEDADAYADVGGRGAADRGRVGARRARRARRRRLHLGRRARAARRAARQLLARRLPVARRSPATGRPRRSARSRPTGSGCSTWPATSGSGRRTGTAAATARRSRDPAPAAVRDPAQGRQGRLVPVRRQLLPALPARRAAAADDRHRHEPHRLPLRQPDV